MASFCSQEGGQMTRNDLDTLESTLVDIASIGGHVETAVIFLKHNRPAEAVCELQQALTLVHRAKLHVMAVRWMSAPRTFQRLIEEQLEWLRKRYA
jgi:hypothetical protein